MAIKTLALFFQHPHSDLNASLAQYGYSPSADLGKRVNTSHDTPSDAFPHNQFGTRRSLAVVSARLKADIDGGVFQQIAVSVFHRSESIHLGMTLTTPHMIALADDASFGDDDSSDHWVRACVLQSVCRQLQAASHVSLVCCHIISGGGGYGFPPKLLQSYKIYIKMTKNIAESFVFRQYYCNFAA